MGITLTIVAGTTVTMTPQRSDYDVSVQRVIGGRKRELSDPGLIDLIVEGRLHAKGGWWSWQDFRLGNATAPSKHPAGEQSGALCFRVGKANGDVQYPE